MSLSQEISLSISEPEDENKLVYKNKRNVLGKIILFSFDTLKLQYFAHLSLPLYVPKCILYSLPFGKKVCHFLGGDVKGRGRKNSVKGWMLTKGGWGPKSPIFVVTLSLNGP